MIIYGIAHRKIVVDKITVVVIFIQEKWKWYGIGIAVQPNSSEIMMAAARALGEVIVALVPYISALYDLSDLYIYANFITDVIELKVQRKIKIKCSYYWTFSGQIIICL